MSFFVHKLLYTLLYALWEKLCSVFFDSQGGTKVETQSVKQNSLCSYPLTPEKENYIFLYWTDEYSYDEETGEESFGAAFDFYSSITDDITLYAVYSQVSNTLSFNSMGGSAVESQTVLLAEHPSRPEEPAREGYTFTFWSTDEEGTNEFFFESALLSGDKTLFANWELVYLDVVFDSRGGGEFEAQSVGYGQKAAFPGIPEKAGDVFKRWSLYDGDLAVFAGDLAAISGKENLAQGLFNRLATASGKRLRLASYGIRDTIGDAQAVQSYLASAITQTIQADPRVSSLEEITLEGAGDSLHVAISWEDVNGEQGAFEGEI